MELIKKYWYVLVGLVLVFFMFKKKKTIRRRYRNVRQRYRNYRNNRRMRRMNRR